jgi:hypothetical protein
MKGEMRSEKEEEEMLFCVCVRIAFISSTDAILRLQPLLFKGERREGRKRYSSFPLIVHRSSYGMEE